MKIFTLMVFVASSVMAHGADKLFDETLATNAVAVLRVDHASPCPIPSKILDFYTVWPRHVLKNESSENLDHTFLVAALKGRSGIPREGCTIYIERYWPETGEFNKTKGAWILVGGDATNGVSHVVNKF